MFALVFDQIVMFGGISLVVAVVAFALGIGRRAEEGAMDSQEFLRKQQQVEQHEQFEQWHRQRERRREQDPWQDWIDRPRR